jgi:hypothetical protein
MRFVSLTWTLEQIFTHTSVSVAGIPSFLEERAVFVREYVLHFIGVSSVKKLETGVEMGSTVQGPMPSLIQ